MTKEQIYTIAESHIGLMHRESDKMDADNCAICYRIRTDFLIAPYGFTVPPAEQTATAISYEEDQHR